MSSTILLVSRTMVARADVNGSGTPTVRRQTRAAGTLIDGVEAASKLGERLRGQVWLLTDEVFTQGISVAAGAVRGLPEAEVTKALAFEASTLSGIAAEHSVLASKPLPSEGREAEYWVTQIGRPEIEQLRKTVRGAGGRLAGVAHPAGLPAGLRHREGAWRRVEIWQDLTATVEGRADGSIVVRAGRGDLSRRTPQDALPSEILVAGTRPAPPRVDADVLRLEDEATLQVWLSWWSRVLGEKTPAVPILRAPDVALSRALRLGVAVGFFAAIIAGALLHYLPLREERTRLQGELVRAQEPAKRFADLKRQLEAAEKEIDQLRATAGPTGTAWSRLPARILDLLATRCPPGLVVDTLEAGWDRTTVRGLCKDPLTADRLAESLGKELAADACRVSPPTKTLRGDNTGQYEFQLEIVSSSASAAPAVARPRRGD